MEIDLDLDLDLDKDGLRGDIKECFINQLRSGKTGNEATNEVLLRFREELDDSDIAPLIWITLAEVQWEYGILERDVKEKAVDYIHKEESIILHLPNSLVLQNYINWLNKTEQKILSAQPPEKKPRNRKLFHCSWNIGDVYAYRLSKSFDNEDKSIEQYIYFVKVEEGEWYPGHIVPIVYIYNIIGNKILDLNALSQIEYVPQFFVPSVYEKNPLKKKLYLLKLLSTSSRIVPTERLTFIGNLSEVKRINNEDLNPYTVSWKDFEDYVLKNFKNWT